MPHGISVIICCFNSAKRITATLQHLVNQKNILSSRWEIILVDNASTDKTAELAKHIWDNYNKPKPALRVVYELTPGLSAARKKGIEEAKYDYVLFCDDDNWLCEDYLEISLDIMTNHPGIGVLGGVGHPVFEGKEPPYFWINQFHTLAVGIQAENEGDITDGRGVLYGAGMILNKPAFEILQNKFKFQFLLTDRKGDSLISSGDHELCFALKRIGYRVYYSPRLNFKHFLPAYRTTIEYYKKLFLSFGISYALLHVYRVNADNVFNLKNDYRYICLRSIKNIVLVKMKLFIQGYYFNYNKYKYIEDLHHLYSNLGVIKSFIKVRNLYQIQFTTLPIFNNRNKIKALE